MTHILLDAAETHVQHKTHTLTLERVRMRCTVAFCLPCGNNHYLLPKEFKNIHNRVGLKMNIIYLLSLMRAHQVQVVRIVLFIDQRERFKEPAFLS